jgi:2-polyprenyl-6-hydroxyphenyl methylase/3-demethylubiquinone-9 3-methyltransferase
MRAPRIVQKAMRGLYVGTFALGLLATGRNPARYMREQRDRGMEFHHNVHDWMGGYPYESTDAPSVDRFMRERGFEAADVRPTRIWALGLWGSGCSEYVYRRL